MVSTSGKLEKSEKNLKTLKDLSKEEIFARCEELFKSNYIEES